MPIIFFECSNKDCKNLEEKFYKTNKNIPDELACKKCSSISDRLLSPPNSISTQIIDNGLQSRQVEVKNIVVEKERERMLRGDK